MNGHVVSGSFNIDLESQVKGSTDEARKSTGRSLLSKCGADM